MGHGPLGCEGCPPHSLVAPLCNRPDGRAGAPRLGAAPMTSLPVTTRFAPSPTGRLHVGNLRTALHNWLWARAQGGRFLLRLDDTDQARSTAENAAAIEADLAWFGLDWDDRVRQSDRFALYEREFERLRAAGRVYPAYETPEELDLRRKILAGRGLPPIYERTALSLTDEDRAPWLARLHERVASALKDGEDLVLACSALKGPYRERLTVDASRQRWVYLHAPREVLAQRLSLRQGHFMPPTLLDSQLADLEVPEGALSVDVSADPDTVLARVLAALGLDGHARP